MVVELYACGFNAHGQLSLGGTINDEPKDVVSFKKIAAGQELQVCFAGWNSTLLLIDKNNFQLLGYIAKDTDVDASQSFLEEQVEEDNPNPLHLKSFFGTHNGPIGAISDTGVLHLIQSATASSAVQFIAQGAEDSPKLAYAAITGTDRLAVTFLQSPASHLTHSLEFHSLTAFVDWYVDPSTPSGETSSPSRIHHMVPGRAKQLEANATGFTLLMEDGNVFTWGDARHHRCLGRAVSPEAPADKPGLVEALAGVPVAKIASNGWLSAALSRDRDLYIWGCSPPGSTGQIQALPAGSGADAEEVKLAEIRASLDVLDVAVGTGHIAALTLGGRVFVTGENESGQLGLGPRGPKFAEDWVEVEELKVRNAAQVVCGDRSIFVLLGGP